MDVPTAIEPLTSAVQAPARLAGSILPITTGQDGVECLHGGPVISISTEPWRQRGLIGVGGGGEGPGAPRSRPAGPGGAVPSGNCSEAPARVKLTLQIEAEALVGLQ